MWHLKPLKRRLTKHQKFVRREKIDRRRLEAKTNIGWHRKNPVFAHDVIESMLNDFRNSKSKLAHLNPNGTVSLI